MGGCTSYIMYKLYGLRKYEVNYVSVRHLHYLQYIFSHYLYNFIPHKVPILTNMKKKYICTINKRVSLVSSWMALVLIGLVVWMDIGFGHEQKAVGEVVGLRAW